MRAEEPQLQLLGLLLGNRDGDEAAEAGVDAVRVLARAVRGALDELARGAHAVACAVGQFRRCALDGDRPDIVDGEVVAGETNCHGSSLLPGFD